MKRSGVVLAVLALLSAGAFAAWDRMALDFPVERTITNAESKKLAVIIQGKMDGILFVDRVADRERFEVPVRSLSLADRLFLLRLPDRAAPEPPPASKEPDEPYIVSRLDRIDQLRQKGEVYREEIKSRDPKDSLHKLRVVQLSDLEREIEALEASIEIYKSQKKRK